MYEKSQKQVIITNLTGIPRAIRAAPLENIWALSLTSRSVLRSSDSFCFDSIFSRPWTKSRLLLTFSIGSAAYKRGVNLTVRVDRSTREPNVGEDHGHCVRVVRCDRPEHSQGATTKQKVNIKLIFNDNSHFHIRWEG